MSLFSVFLIGIGLSMDACAVSFAKGICLKKQVKTYALKLGLAFGFFQAMMPLIGWWVGTYFESFIMWSPIGWLKSRNECCNLSIGLYIVLAPLYLKSVRKLQEKRFVFVKILAIIIPENGAKVSKIKCFQFAQQTLNRTFAIRFRYLLMNAVAFTACVHFISTLHFSSFFDHKFTTFTTNLTLLYNTRQDG